MNANVSVGIYSGWIRCNAIIHECSGIISDNANIHRPGQPGQTARNGAIHRKDFQLVSGGHTDRLIGMGIAGIGVDLRTASHEGLRIRINNAHRHSTGQAKKQADTTGSTDDENIFLRIRLHGQSAEIVVP